VPSSRRDHLRRNARHLVQQRFGWDTIGRRFVALVEETVHAQRQTQTLPPFKD
jgi:hypothetical protein